MAHHAFIISKNVSNTNDILKRVCELHEIEEDRASLEFFSYASFSVEDARALRARVERMVEEKTIRIILISFSSASTEAQNALLKILEEPPEGAVLVLAVPTLGIMIPTILSRTLPLFEPQFEKNDEKNIDDEACSAKIFLEGSDKERIQIIERILTTLKSSKEDDKFEARKKSRSLMSACLVHGYQLRFKGNTSEELFIFLKEVDMLLPYLYDQSAPLKPILEHVRLVAPHIKG